MADSSSTFVINVELNAGNIGAQLNSELDRMKASTTGLDGELNKVQKSLSGAGDAAGVSAQKLAGTRYALYDVSRTATITGTALLGIATATVAVAIAWERDFAQVIRTTGITGDEVEDLRGKLVGLAQQMPATFGDITQVAALAGQLGIAKDEVAGFTETVIKFTSASNLSVEEAGTAFGRLNALLPDVQGDFNALGSSIAKVGVESVATESQIVNISTQISSMGAYAGLTAAEVVGLSGALASIGAPPEISRGTITRLFTLMGKSISEGGDSLENFARISGVSSAEFAAAFGTSKFGPIFQSFIEGLAGISTSGGDAVATLGDLGVKSVRDVPLLLRLAGAGDLLGQAFQDANQGYSEGTELNRQYGIVAETTAAKLQVLVNNVMAFLDSVGSASTGPLKGFVDMLTDMMKRLTDFASTPIGQTISLIVVGMTALFGALLLVGGALIAGVAGIIGMQQALAGLTGATTVSSIGLKGLQAQLVATGTTGMVASRAITALGVGLKTLGIGAALLLLPEILGAVGRGISDLKYELGGMDKGFDSAFARVLEDVGSLQDKLGSTDFAASITRGLSGLSSDTLLQDLKLVDEQIAQMANSGDIKTATKLFDELRFAWVKAGNDTGIFNAAFTDSKAAIDNFKPSADAAAGAVDALGSAEEEAAAQTETLAASIGLVPDELKAMSEALTTGSAAFFSYGDIIKASQEASKAWAEGMAADTEDANDTWENFYDGTSVTIQDFNARLEEQITAQGKWADDLGILTARGATSFVTEMAKLGPEGQQLAAQAVNLTTDELNKLEENARLAAFLSSKAFADGFTQNIPMLQAAYKAGGLEAVQALIKAQVSAAPGAVNEVINKYNIQLAGKPMQLQASDRPARATADGFARYFAGLNPTTYGNAYVRATLYGDPAAIRALNSQGFSTNGPPGQRINVGMYASGGHVTGPGSGTSDSITARLSNGEYVIRAKMVDKYGPGFFNALNSGKVPKFAGGGQVGGSSVGGSMIGGVMELGPRTIKALSQEVRVSGMGDVEISRASQRGDAKRRAMGDL